MKFNSEKEIKGIITNLVEISISAGKEIMNIYSSSINYSIKNDGSPLTLADTKSHNFIVDSSKKLDPAIPIISEEGKKIPFHDRSNWSHFWLIDPLDGTKEFINRNGEFTTNIALIKNNIPIIGIVHSPVSKETYSGSELLGSYFIDRYGEERKLNINIANLNRIPRVALSRSHSSRKTEEFLKLLGKHQIIRSGSSIKFCMVADNKVDIYPRLSPTSEWDTAAGHAVAIYAGAEVYTYKDFLEYNKKSNYINNNFIVTNNKYIKPLSVFKHLEKRNRNR